MNLSLYFLFEPCDYLFLLYITMCRGFFLVSDKEKLSFLISIENISFLMEIVNERTYMSLIERSENDA
jgi:hypothetical protein